MATKTEIANIAIALVGGEIVTNVDVDDSKEAQLIRINYDASKEATLEAQEWSFAIRRFEPPLSPDAPLYEWANKFTPPGEIIRVLTCDQISTNQFDTSRAADNPKPPQVEWEFEDGFILSNETRILARGITRDVEEGDFSPTFVQAFAARLAMMIAMPLTQSNQIFANAGGLYHGFIMEAKTRDGMQGRAKRIRNRSLMQVR